MSKTLNNQFDKCLTYKKLYQAYKRASLGKGNKKKVLVYSKDLERNLIELKKELENNTYKVSEYNSFVIYEPKVRIIKALPFKDRVVQQWYIKEFIISNILPKFIYDSYACLDNKGTHKAVNRVQYFMREMKREYGKYYILKCDIKKFFNNIDRDILYKIINKHIIDKKVLNLTKILIFDDDKKKSLPIGNYCSQYFSNIYLNEFDYFIKYKLKIKYYVRLADDFVILLENKEECKKILNEIIIFLDKELKLELNNRTKYFSNTLGVDFCGYRIFETHKIIRKRIKKNIRKKISKWNELAENKKLDVKKMDISLNSYFGHIQHSNSYKMK